MPSFLFLCGAIVSRLYQNFVLGWRSQITESVIVNQNTVLTHWVMRMNERLLQEFVFASADSSGKTIQSSQEINCKNEHVELVERMMDEIAREVVRDVASWAHGALSSFSLKLRNMTLEPDAPSDHDREYDIVLVFHVIGDGKDALRFSAEVSRKMREAATGKDSARILRTDVRWM